MQSIACVLLFMSVLLSAALHTNAQDQSQETQRQNTGFRAVGCDGARNRYLFQISNGFILTTQFFVVLDCEGIGSNTITEILPALAPSDTLVIAPSSGNVSNRLCRLRLEAVDPYTTERQSYDTLAQSCGVAVTNEDDDDCNHGIDDWIVFTPCPWKHYNWMRNVGVASAVWISIAGLGTTIIVIFIAMNYKMAQEDFRNASDKKIQEYQNIGNIVNKVISDGASKATYENNIPTFYGLSKIGGAAFSNTSSATSIHDDPYIGDFYSDERYDASNNPGDAERLTVVSMPE